MLLRRVRKGVNSWNAKKDSILVTAAKVGRKRKERQYETKDIGHDA